MRPGPQSNLFAVLGHPIAHTLSPAMHHAAFDALGKDACYLAFDVTPDGLPAVLPALHTLGFQGVNLTIPLKETACGMLADLDESAQRMRAVNTLVRSGAGWRGHNTDGFGLLAALEEAFGSCIAGADVFILGAGGAGRAAALTLARQTARSITLSDARTDKAGQVAAEIAAWPSAPPVRCVAPDAAVPAAREAGLLIQATPLGMKPGDPSPLDPSVFHPGQKVFDMIYMYPETPLMAAARRAGAAVANGLGMLLHQGAEALRLWTGWDPPLEAMRGALEKEVYG